MLNLEDLGPRDINNAVQDHMRDMHALRAELARQRLRHCSQRELAR